MTEKNPSKTEPDHFRLLGEAVVARCDEVLAETVAKTSGSGQVVEKAVQGSFERICTNSTIAVARWIAGDGLEVTNEAAIETPEVLAKSLEMLQLSLEFSLLRVCECFEEERKRTDDELARRDEELAFLATHDPLTGLPNRTLILDRVEQMLARGARSKTPVAALFIDLDNFKGINDTLGHGVGDELLQAVAARLKGVVRQADDHPLGVGHRRHPRRYWQGDGGGPRSGTFARRRHRQSPRRGRRRREGCAGQDR